MRCPSAVECVAGSFLVLAVDGGWRWKVEGAGRSDGQATTFPHAVAEIVRARERHAYTRDTQREMVCLSASLCLFNSVGGCPTRSGPAILQSTSQGEHTAPTDYIPVPVHHMQSE